MLRIYGYAHMAQTPLRCHEKGLNIMFDSYQLACKVLIYVIINDFILQKEN